jgi:hypothetical protein
MESIPELEQILADHGIRWAALDLRRHGLLWKEWSDKYGLMFQQRMRFKRGEKARFAFEQICADHFYVLSVPNGLLVPYVTSGRRFGYDCWSGGSEALPDFSPLHDYELCITPPDFEWTMVHTHEDDALAPTPAFMRLEWLP